MCQRAAIEANVIILDFQGRGMQSSPVVIIQWTRHDGKLPRKHGYDDDDEEEDETIKGWTEVLLNQN